MNIIERNGRGEPKAVEMTDEEEQYWEKFEALLDEGFGIVEAVTLCKVEATQNSIEFSQDFWNWLGQ